jgi:hypothetical protein
MSDKLELIRRLYFGARRDTIQRDFDRAIDILKSMASETERERASVFMEGLAEMRRHWTRRGHGPLAAARRPKP